MNTKLTKEAAPKSQPQYYTVKIEATMPCTLTFKVLAENPQEAIKKARKAKPNNVQPQLNGRKDLKATVYKFGYSMIELVMSLIGK